MTEAEATQLRDEANAANQGGWLRRLYERVERQGKRLDRIAQQNALLAEQLASITVGTVDPDDDEPVADRAWPTKLETDPDDAYPVPPEYQRLYSAAFAVELAHEEWNDTPALAVSEELLEAMAEVYEAMRAIESAEPGEPAVAEAERDVRWCSCGQPWVPAAGLYGTTEETRCPGCVLREACSVKEAINIELLTERNQLRRERNIATEAAGGGTWLWTGSEAEDELEDLCEDALVTMTAGQLRRLLKPTEPPPEPNTGELPEPDAEPEHLTGPAQR
jgi:hypothetical protein